MNKKLLKIFTAVLLVAVLALAGCGSNVVAKVNGESITRQQLDERVEGMKQYFKQQGMNLDLEEASPMLEMLKRQTLEEMINQELVLQEAKKQGIAPKKQDIDQEIKSLKESFKSEAEFKQFLAANGISEPKLYDLVEKDFMATELQKKVTAGVKEVTEAEARVYYDSNKDQFTQPQQYEVRHILLATQGKSGEPARVEAQAKAEALSVLNQLNQGKDFAVLAQEKSEDPGSASNGGLYTFKNGDAVPEFEKAALALKPGEITRMPVKTEFGYHVIKLEKIIPAATSSFEEVKAGIIKDLNEKARQDKFAGYMAGVKEKSAIVNNLDQEKEDAKKKE